MITFGAYDGRTGRMLCAHDVRWSTPEAGAHRKRLAPAASAPSKEEVRSSGDGRYHSLNHGAACCGNNGFRERGRPGKAANEASST